MAKDAHQLRGGFETENTGGVLSGFLAEEDAYDRRSLWRIGSWGAGAVGAVVLAVLANQSSMSLNRELVAADELARQAQQIRQATKESQNETRRLASAVDTLNGDRDRLFSRVTVLEQGLDSVTGSLAASRQSFATPPQAVPLPSIASQVQAATQSPVPPPVIAPVQTTVAAIADKPPVVVEATPAPAMGGNAGQATTTTATASAPAPTAATPPAAAKSAPQDPAAAGSVRPSTATAASVPAATASAPSATASTPLVAAKSIMAPPDPAATKLIEPDRPDKPAKTVTAAPMPEVVAAAPPPDATEADEAQADEPKVAVQRTEFGVDVGGANSIPGLRALWRGLLKSKSNAALTTLRPIIVVKESSTGLGMQLRLVAGPLSDAAAAAKICATMVENDRACGTTVFDGQRLALKADEPTGSIDARAAAKPDAAKPDAAKPDAAKSDTVKPDAKAVAVKPAAHRHSTSKRVTNDPPAKKPDSPSTFSSFFSRR
jgi:hypothetical protein